MKAIIQLMMANEIFVGIGKSLCFENHVQHSCFKYMLVEKKCAKNMDSEFLILYFFSFSVYSVTFSMHVLKQIVYFIAFPFLYGWLESNSYQMHMIHYDVMQIYVSYFLVYYMVCSRRRHDLNLKLGSNAFLWAIRK